MRWLSAAGKKTLDGRRPGWGTNHVAVDEAVVGPARAKWTTAPMKRDDTVKGSWSDVMDERHPSLAMDDRVAAPARWRMGWRTEEAGRSGEVVVAPTVYECGNGGGRGISNFGARLSEMWESYELIPHLKFRTSLRLGIGWSSRITQIFAGNDFRRGEGVFAAHSWRPRCMNGADG